MEQEILTPAQKQAIAAVAAAPEMEGFYLTGGTALAAYYFQHRVSDDLDFFIFDEPDRIALEGFVNRLKETLGATSVRFERIYDRSQFFFTRADGEDLKIEFTKYSFRQLDDPIIRDGIKIDSIRDIAANKLMTLVDRFDPKDFVDLFFLLQECSLDQVRRDVEKKFGLKLGAVFLGSEFAKVRRVAELPKMKKPLTAGELKRFFEERAGELGPEIFN